MDTVERRQHTIKTIHENFDAAVALAVEVLNDKEASRAERLKAAELIINTWGANELSKGILLAR